MLRLNVVLNQIMSIITYSAFRKYSDPLTFRHFVMLQPFSKMDEIKKNLHTIPHNYKAKTSQMFANLLQIKN